MPYGEKLSRGEFFWFERSCFVFTANFKHYDNHVNRFGTLQDTTAGQYCPYKGPAVKLVRTSAHTLFTGVVLLSHPVLVPHRTISGTIHLVTEFLADWDWDVMSSLTSVDLPGAERGVPRTPHVVWDTPGVSVQGWSGYTAYALDVSVGSSVEHRFAGPDAVLSRLDDVLKTITTAVASSNATPVKGVKNVPAGTRAYELHRVPGESIFLLAHAEIQESSDPCIRLRVVLWNQALDPGSAATSAAGLAVKYAKLTWRETEPKALMQEIAGAFGVDASAIDGASTASIVAASKGQSLSVIVQSRFVWWFTFFAMALALMFFSVVVLFGDLPISSLLELGVMFVVGAWALVTTRRNWRRRKGR